MMRQALLVSLLLAAVLAAAPSRAVIETYEFTEPELEERYQELSAELRCPKCQNQNIADSNAPISQDLRKLLHQQLEQGASDEEIRQYMVDRYGEFVRYRPRFSGATALLWLAPIILLILGVVIAMVTLRDRRQPGATEGAASASELTDAEQQRLRELMKKADSE
ncbi:cytochrome c-type biogenesis protein CcmH [Pseudohalioglobus sediminis]|uniref:Cytochrome c-type biogenesis protein n=2 Tax=Pseudohalioglobus sediminis TaxID=2606449 RepID=A0A5B0WPM0_9GAMM|nr:cytochrome c-type biogenesis protein [Pseudohalioglobus sediminis]KAA1188151.1 cytochrome c-type biogenesis protein CcmH [Pseudohalioglobus sediminis]